jgi:hypothetical protein
LPMPGDLRVATAMDDPAVTTPPQPANHHPGNTAETSPPARQIGHPAQPSAQDKSHKRAVVVRALPLGDQTSHQRAVRLTTPSGQTQPPARQLPAGAVAVHWNGSASERGCVSHESTREPNDPQKASINVRFLGRPEPAIKYTEPRPRQLLV